MVENMRKCMRVDSRKCDIFNNLCDMWVKMNDVNAKIL